MQTFGKRQYAHMELDPWAMKKKPREQGIPATRITGYLVAFAMVGVVAVASFRMLVLA